MANKRIKRVIIAGAGFSAPAKLPIQSRIIDRMAEVPEMDFLTGKMPEESMTFLDAFITVGLFLLDNYAKKDYTEYRVKYQKLVDKDLFLGLGWLLREDKISTQEVEGELFVKLN